MSNKILAFKVAYLLGVEENVLSRDYADDYAISNKLSRFSGYTEAEKLRSLSRARLSILRYNHLYSENKKLQNITGPYLSKEIKYLESRGIDLCQMYSELNQVDYFNKLSEYIDEICINVLKEVGLPRPEIISELFNFPVFNSKDFQKFLKLSKTFSCPHGMIFYNSLNLRQSLPYSLVNNKNLYMSTYSMLGKKYDGGLDLEYGYDWDTDVKILDILMPNKFIASLKDNTQFEICNPLKNSNISKLSFKEEYETSIPLSDKSLLKFIENNETEIFVDCDNSDFFKFMNFLRVLEGQTNIKGIKLIVDMKSNFLWKVFKELYRGTIPVTIVQVQRIKENKSVADVVLTKEICESYYTRNLRQAIIVSSDSDFFGLITSLEDMLFCITYTDSQMNDEYLCYLENNNITVYNLVDLESEEVFTYYVDICIEYLLAYTLAQTPAIKWEIPHLSQIVNFHLTKETHLKIEYKYIEDKVNKLMEDVKLSISGVSTIIAIKNISINASEI